MTEIVLNAIVGAVCGVGLGYFYFGGLWATVQRLPDAKNPAFLAVTSMFGRLVVTMLGFYFVWQGNFLRLVCAVAGFIAARTLLVHRLGKDLAELTTAEDEERGDGDATES